MALSRAKVWSSGEVLYASDLNAEFNNILNNPVSLISPLTATLDLDGNTLVLDSAGVTMVSSTAAGSWVFTSGAKAGTPSTTGSITNYSAATFTDSNTAGSGTATSYVAHALQRPTLAATNASVVTTDAATLYIANSPLAGANETISNAWALWVDAGNSRFDGSVQSATFVHGAQFSSVTQALTDGASIAWDASLGSTATLTLTASGHTMSAPSNLRTGGRYTLHVTQDSTGGRTLLFNAVFKNQGGATTLPVPSPSASTLTTYVFESPDGTNLQLVNLAKQPTIQVLTSGSSATYTTPTGATRIKVRLVGGGGGGGGATANNGTAGNNTTFSTLTGSGGAAGIAAGTGTAAGGAAANGDINIPGGGGQAGSTSALAGDATQGGQGGASAFGGAGAGALAATGGNGATNSGGGGGGGGGNGVSQSGGGGGSGGYVEKTIFAPAATYTYTVGAAANGGSAGTNAGGNGAAGIIIVDEYYN